MDLNAFLEHMSCGKAGAGQRGPSVYVSRQSDDSENYSEEEWR